MAVQTGTDQRWWLVQYVCGKAGGIRHVRAPDAETARRDLREHPSEYGLAHATILVGRADPLRATDQLDGFA